MHIHKRPARKVLAESAAMADVSVMRVQTLSRKSQTPSNEREREWDFIYFHATFLRKSHPNPNIISKYVSESSLIRAD